MYSKVFKDEWQEERNSKLAISNSGYTENMWMNVVWSVGTKIEVFSSTSKILPYSFRVDGMELNTGQIW